MEQPLVHQINNKMKRIFFALLLFTSYVNAQQLAPLTVEKIMRDPKWMGVSPSNFSWTPDSKSVIFTWNPEGKEREQTYKVNVGETTPLVYTETPTNNPTIIFNKDGSFGVYEKNGDLFLVPKGKSEIQLFSTLERESNPRFMPTGEILFQRGDNFFVLDYKTGALNQLTNIIRGKRPAANPRSGVAQTSEQDKWLNKQQLELFDYFKKAAPQRPAFRGMSGNMTPGKVITPIYTDDKTLTSIAMSPDGKYLTFRLITPATGNRNIIVPNYVTRSGYVENINGRTNVGETPSTSENFVYNVVKDSLYKIRVEDIPGIRDLPDYVKDYPAQLAERQKKNELRNVSFSSVSWNENGSAGIVNVRSVDNKDIWILQLDGETGKLSLIDRRRDDAWVGGPVANGAISWIDAQKFYYRSEATGYAHLYVYNVVTKEKKQLTSGNWEVQRVQLSKDKKTFFITANKEHPGITHFYKLKVDGGNMEQITSMKGGNEVTISPDEKWLAINYSYMNKPGELYIQENKANAVAKKITQSTTKEFDSYAWREPEMVSFKNRFGSDVYARVYPAANPHPSRPAVVFVHGAGYLQNVHYWWSTYFREYMFHNLLADNGYTVIDIDYTGSSGYGRDHRTGIYRHMGGKDLSDHVDGVKMLVDKYGVNPKNVGIYGGSYGGFITLMAMFNEPDVFASGAALRSVTDWAHYNHGYTSNILNEPVTDNLAYQRSSPINFANGLKGNLLMAHGVVDDNVTFSDIIRLSQKLIELGKDNWELAVYPVEPHGFTEPSSWTDEYKRIYKLFETTLKTKK